MTPFHDTIALQVQHALALRFNLVGRLTVKQDTFGLQCEIEGIKLRDVNVGWADVHISDLIRRLVTCLNREYVPIEYPHILAETRNIVGDYEFLPMHGTWKSNRSIELHILPADYTDTLRRCQQIGIEVAYFTPEYLRSMGWEKEAIAITMPTKYLSMRNSR